MWYHLGWLGFDLARWRATRSRWALGFAALMAWAVARDVRRRGRRTRTRRRPR